MSPLSLASKIAPGAVGLLAGWMLGPKLRAYFDAHVLPDEDEPAKAPKKKKGGMGGGVRSSSPSGLKTLTQAERDAAYGPVTWTEIPGISPEHQVKLNPEALANFVTVMTPLLAPIGVKSVTLHRKVVGPFQTLLQAWKDEGVLGDVLTFAGGANPRLVEGTTTLSNHAYGSAFDINAQWNGRGTTGAEPGTKGSIHRLLPAAERLGWFNGLYFSTTPDPMHFELVKA